jgi:tetratricopeptide (TPR) repeat protein
VTTTTQEWRTKNCGVIYVATKLDRYVEEAFLSAESVKRHAPNLKVTLFTDRPQNPLCGVGCFDDVQTIASQSGFGLAWAEGQLDRIACLARTPYELTLHLDTDTRVFSDALSTLFRFLDEYDVAMVEERFDFSYASKHSGRRMFNAGFILYRRNAPVSQWLKLWEERVRRNFNMALKSPVPIVPELADVTDEDIRRLLLRMDQIALMEILSPEVNLLGLQLMTLDDSWNYRGTKSSENKNGSVKIVHSEEYKASTKADILDVALAWLKAGSDDRAQRLYDYIAYTLPPIPSRKPWLPWAQSPSRRSREEWAVPSMRRADLHLRYGQVKAAVEMLESMTGSVDHVLALTTRARIALMAGAVADSVDLATEAMTEAPASAYAGRVLGEALLAAQRPIDAIPPLKIAAQQGYSEAMFHLGRAWFALRNYRKAAAAYKNALTLNPDDGGSANNLLPALLGMRQYRAARNHADQMLAKHPNHTAALAFKCVALGELGQDRELTTLMNHERLLLIEHMPPPKGYQDVAAFNRALSQTLNRDSSLAFEPEGHTTRFGRQTSDLANSASSAIQILNSFCISAAQRRMRSVLKQSDHPFDRNVPRVYRLYSWAVIMEENGHQTPHIHASGWLSGVYYVEVPEEIRRDDPERNGWLEFGPSEERWHRSGTPIPVQEIFPEPGLLVTFPSFFWHNTRPLRSKQRRISFAFDIVPV